jgi:acyl-CoA reductase-like NAD-dependent aldehyde dehydrogenase
VNGSLGVRNPRTGQIDYAIAPPGPGDLDALAHRMREAQRAWHGRGLDARLNALRLWRDELARERDAVIEALTLDTGRHGVSALELDLVLGHLDRWCRLAPSLLADRGEQDSDVPTIKLRGSQVPYALVGIISPWNFPLLLSTLDTIPALVAGCAAIVKPSEIAPRFMRPLIRTIQAVDGLREVLAFIEGAGETGAALIDRVDMICFTGSVATGRKVAQAAALRFIPSNLELGGKDPAIVCDDADLELAASAIVWGAVANTGQSCLSIERVYVDARVHDAFVEHVVARARGLKLAYPDLDDGPIGPIIAERQATTIADHLADAKTQGAVVRCGGDVESLGGGWWCRPTVLTNVSHSMRVMTEETFGPIIPIMPFEGDDQAVHLANDTIFGLSAAVFSGDEARALGIAARLDAGAISINDAALTAVIHEGEKNAFRFSGMGESRMGAASLRRFLRRKTYLIKKNAAANPWWFSELTQ